jgi:Na+-driven multidrug efflux pump
MQKLARPEVNAAGFLILTNIAMWIESPIIDLLSTSTTLSKDRQRFDQLTRFVWMLMGFVTVMHVALTVTPAYWFITERILGVNREVADVARPGMLIMSTWSAMIGWRRYLQGLLIRTGKTRIITFGTASRVVVLSIVAACLLHWTGLTGVEIAATAMLSGVFAEAVFVHLASRQAVHEIQLIPQQSPELTLGQLAGFHFPMTATTLVNLMMGPIIAAGLARTPDPILMLAGFQVAATIIFMHRAVAFCLPEVVIALYRDEQSRLAMKRFCMMVAALASANMLLLSITGWDYKLFHDVLGAPPRIAITAHFVFTACALAPFLDGAQAYARGVLTAHHLTMSRLVAVGIAAVFLLAAVGAGITLHWSGPVLAGVAISTSLTAELLSLVTFWVRAQLKPMRAPAAG